MPLMPELSPQVQAALDTGRPVVALESTIISHGLPRPANLEAARSFEAMLTDAGVVPATIAVVDGVPRAGLDESSLHAARHRRRERGRQPGRRARQHRSRWPDRHGLVGAQQRAELTRNRRPPGGFSGYGIQALTGIHAPVEGDHLVGQVRAAENGGRHVRHLARLAEPACRHLLA
jgi:hypothetical protein